MNKRINELKRMATLWCDDNIHEQFSEETGGYGGAWEDKFAELIVRECCGVLTENVEVALDASGSPVYPEGLICEHFGVEE